jgi:hypothetical protein
VGRAIEAAIERALENRAARRRHEKRDRQRGQERDAEPRHRDHGHVAARHGERAMGEVHEVHEAHRHRQAEAYDEEQASVSDSVK